MITSFVIKLLVTILRYVYAYIIIMAISNMSLASTIGKHALKQGENYYNQGDYQKAILAIKAINLHLDLDNSDEIKLALKINAISYFLLGDEKKAIHFIDELFYMDPGYVFNEFDTPPLLVKLAAKQQDIIRQKNQEILAIKSIDDSKKNMITKETVIIEKKPPLIISLLPLGINHFYIHSPIKGSIYGSLQGLGLIANIWGYWQKHSYIGGDNLRHLSYETIKQNGRQAQYVQWTGFGIMSLSLVVSVIDAIISIRNLPDIISQTTLVKED